MKSPVGVAYRADVGKVMATCISCGEAISMALNSPKPTPIFLAFGG